MIRILGSVVIGVVLMVFGGCRAHTQAGNTAPAPEAAAAPAAAAGDIGTPLPCPPEGQSDMFGPVMWAVDEAGERWGAGLTQAAEVQTSLARPVEVCGVRGQLIWLAQLTCADGSAAFPNTDLAHRARVGSMGAGGRCGTIIDLYTVTCPEASYEIYLDAYHCADGESFL